MLEVREMVGYAVVYTGWTGIPGPVITTTVPHGSELVVSQGGTDTRFQDCIVFFVYVELEGTYTLYAVTWDIDDNYWSALMANTPLTVRMDPAVNFLVYGLE
jgi:hypothetical protein